MKRSEIIRLFRKLLTARQKFFIKYVFAIFSLINLRSFILKQEFQTVLFSLFQQLRPVKIELDFIRIGGNNDGSYLVPVTGIKYDGVVSPGVGRTYDFDRAIVDDDCLVVLVDGTVEEPVSLPKNFVFLPKMLHSADDAQDNQVSLKTLTNRYFSSARALVLQMDIEGGEYEVLNSIEPEVLDPYALVLVEFHHLHRILESNSWKKSIEGAIKLLSNDFVLIHTHPNNVGKFFLWKFKIFPKVVETTWLKKSYVEKSYGWATLPHPLDQRNDPTSEDIYFPTIQQK